MFVLADVEPSGSKSMPRCEPSTGAVFVFELKMPAKDYSAVKLNHIKAIALIARGLVVDDGDERRPPLERSRYGPVDIEPRPLSIDRA
jgi:hypothetical protein